MMWLAITIPAGIFGSIILQVRAAERAKKVAKQVNARIAEIEAESRLSSDSRRGSATQLDQSLPDKHPLDEL
jgi:type II secretory pathway component PulK